MLSFLFLLSTFDSLGIRDWKFLEKGKENLLQAVNRCFSVWGLFEQDKPGGGAKKSSRYQECGVFFLKCCGIFESDLYELIQM